MTNCGPFCKQVVCRWKKHGLCLLDWMRNDAITECRVLMEVPAFKQYQKKEMYLPPESDYIYYDPGME